MKKTIIFILTMFMWFIASLCSFHYTMENHEIMGAIITGLLTMMFGGFVLEGMFNLYKQLK